MFAELKPFHEETKLWVSADLKRMDHFLSGRFYLRGRIDGLSLPTNLEGPSRGSNLYEKTCFEVFLQAEGSPYVELNFSTRGEWDAFYFDDYRKLGDNNDLHTNVEEIVCGFENTKIWYLEFKLTLEQIFEHLDTSALKPLRCGIAAIVEREEKGYWALGHFDEKPNFHNFESFNATI